MKSPTYLADHKRLWRRRGKASEYQCIRCDDQAEEWAQKHGTSGTSIWDYDPMCKPCHYDYDNPSRDAANKRTWSNPIHRENISKAVSASNRRRAGKKISKVSASKGKPWSAARRAAEAARITDPNDNRRTLGGRKVK